MHVEEKLVSEEELAHWLAFSKLDGVGPRRLSLLIEQLESVTSAWKAPPAVLESIRGFGPETVAAIQRGRHEIDPDKLLAEFKKTGLTALTWNDRQYPLQLKHIADPPVVLYVNGVLSEAMLAHAVGVVGTRRPTAYGHKIAADVARGLSENGVTVVSGMAIGIDSLAHWGAIEGGSATIAVLGCGPDVCYPSSNKRLFKKLVEEGKGAVVSEYYPGTSPDKFRFPARNRIISGICHALVVVEGGLDSGSLITAYQAFDQSREVFAFPGRIDNPMSCGPHKLIRNNNAHLCTSYTDILDELNWVCSQTATASERPRVVQLYGRERDIYNLLSSEPVHFDTLFQQCSLTVGELSATLTMLELAGVVVRQSGDWYARHADVQVTNSGSQ
jgi:DNA processing protein